MVNKFYVFTDGSCINNGKKNSTGAIGIFFGDNDPDNIGQAIVNENDIKITNQTMELIACVQALKTVNDKINKGLKVEAIYVCTDSSYVINSVTKWYTEWVKNDWKNNKGEEIKNKELIKILFELKSKNITIFKHINAHQDEPEDKNTDEYKFWYGNMMADKLATDASNQYKKDHEKEEQQTKEKNKEKNKKEKKQKKKKEEIEKIKTEVINMEDNINKISKSKNSEPK